MKENYSIKIISYITILILTYVFLYNIYSGITTKPSEGDSIYYHIPVAKYYLTGQIFNPPDKDMITHWYPSASESILALFILFNIPLNLYNVFASMVLLVICYKLGNYYFKSRYLSIIFTGGIINLYGIQRLQHTQNIDIWLVVFFTLSFLLLLNPQKTLSYFLKLGFYLGMIIGSKYSGPLWVFAFLLIYGRRILPYLDVKKAFALLIPILTVGVSWYIRNLIIAGSPIYPQGFLFFPTYAGWEKTHFTSMDYPYIRSIVNFPYLTFSAFISEYMIWVINPLIILLAFIFLKTKRRKKISRSVIDLLSLTIICFLFFSFLPAGDEYKQIVLGMRYSFEPLILSILCIYLLSIHAKLIELLCYFVITNSLIIFLPSYHPKIIFIIIPVVVSLYFIFTGSLRHKILLIKNKLYG